MGRGRCLFFSPRTSRVLPQRERERNVPAATAKGPPANHPPQHWKEPIVGRPAAESGIRYSVARYLPSSRSPPKVVPVTVSLRTSPGLGVKLAPLFKRVKLPQVNLYMSIPEPAVNRVASCHRARRYSGLDGGRQRRERSCLLSSPAKTDRSGNVFVAGFQYAIVNTPLD